MKRFLANQGALVVATCAIGLWATQHAYAAGEAAGCSCQGDSCSSADYGDGGVCTSDYYCYCNFQSGGGYPILADPNDMQGDCYVIQQ